MDALATAAELLTSGEPDVVRLPVVEELKEARRIGDIMSAIHGELAFRHLTGVAVELRADTIFVVSDIPGLCDGMLDMNRSMSALRAHREISRICSAARIHCQFIHPIHFQWMNEELALKAEREALMQPQLPPQPMAVPHPA